MSYSSIFWRKISRNVWVLPVLFLLLLTNCLWAADAPTITVVASGTGKTEETALRQALSNAVSQAVGTIVDAETVVKNDQVIKDQVLTYSNAIVSHYDPVGSPAVADGLVTVKIKAVVERKTLTEKLVASKVISGDIAGKDIFAKVVTSLQEEKDAKKIVAKVFEGFPANLFTAEVAGEPVLLRKLDAVVTLAVPVVLRLDQKRYAEWLGATKPFLKKVFPDNTTDRWAPKEGSAIDYFRRLGDGTPEVKILYGPLKFWIEGNGDFSASLLAKPINQRKFQASSLSVPEKERKPVGFDLIVVPPAELGEILAVKDSWIGEKEEANSLIIADDPRLTSITRYRTDNRDLFDTAYASARRRVLISVSLLDSTSRVIMERQEDGTMDSGNMGGASLNPTWTIDTHSEMYFAEVSERARFMAIFPYAKLWGGGHAMTKSFVRYFIFEVPTSQLPSITKIAVRISPK